MNLRQDPERLDIAAGEDLVHDFPHPRAGMVVNVFDNEVVVLHAHYSRTLQFHVLDTNTVIILVLTVSVSKERVHHGR